MVSKRIKYAREHLSRRRHIAILATPLWRRTQRSDFNCLPRPYSVVHAALRARASKRIKMMAQPKVLKIKYDRQSKASLPYPRDREEGHGSAEPSKRILDLALPKKRALVHARRYLVALGNRHFTENINNVLRGLRKSRYQKYRIICNSLQQRAAAREQKIRRKLRRALKKPADWERHLKYLETLAAPKRVHKPPRRPRVPLHQRKTFDYARMIILAIPNRWEMELDRDPFRVARGALYYKITDHIRELSHREHPRREPPYNIPGRVRRGALLVEASERILELARPAVRPPGNETNLNEDAFSVPPKALKARCSPRTKTLAMPKHRKRRKPS